MASPIPRPTAQNSLPKLGILRVDPEVSEENLLQDQLRQEKERNDVLLRALLSLQQHLAKVENSFGCRIGRVVNRIRRTFSFKDPLSAFKLFGLTFFSKGRTFLRKSLALLAWKIFWRTADHPPRILAESNGRPLWDHRDPYHLWCLQNMARPADLSLYHQISSNLKYQPLISIVMPVYNPNPRHLRQALQSILDQAYPHWQLCIADDNSTNSEIHKVLEEFSAKDSRIDVTYRSENGHISAASNSALTLAKGDFCAFMDHDDVMTPDALFHFALALNDDTDLDILYSDEDKIHDNGAFSDPHFKPQWAPDSLLSRNYIGHCLVIRRAIVEEAGGFRIGYEGSQDYDLILRCSELTQKIRGIPRVLYHWRIHAQSTASSSDAKPYAYNAAAQALEDALSRRQEQATVQISRQNAGYYDIRYHLRIREKVSILLPTRDGLELLKPCLESILQCTEFDDYEIIIVDNNSQQWETKQYLDQLQNENGKKIRVLTDRGEFNFSRLINLAASKAEGAYLLLLNNDTLVLQDDWLVAMMEHCQRNSVGCVGAMLVHDDDTIQHAGVVLGKSGVACHTFVGKHYTQSGYFNYLQSVNNYSAVTGACMMVRREVFEKVGGFDEAFAVSFNDVDFCLRVRQAGYYNVYLPHVRLVHHESKTRGNPLANSSQQAIHIHEIRLLQSRWRDIIENDPCLSPHLRLSHDDFTIRVA